MNEKEDMKIEDAMSVLEGKPTINERLDKLEVMMLEILSRLPQQFDYYNNPYYKYSSTSATTIATNTSPITTSTLGVYKQ